MIFDPIADMLTRIRNANKAQLEEVSVPFSRFKLKLIEIIKKEGYLKDFQTVKDGNKQLIKVFLKYLGKRREEKAISGIKRVSRPGRRVYAPYKKLPNVLSGLGTSVLSTSKGILTTQEAEKNKIGGEVIFHIW